MQIPTGFKLLNHRIRVKSIPAHQWKREDCVGVYMIDKQRIELRDGGGTLPSHIFTHELTHAILDAMGSKLSRDEGFVDAFAGLLDQALSTATYPRQPGRPRKESSADKSKRRRLR
jgi:hypothetical protein